MFFVYCWGTVGPAISYNNYKRLIRLSMIQLSGGHCIKDVICYSLTSVRLRCKTVTRLLSRIWEVTGGRYGLTCNRTDSSASDEDETLLCKNLSIPDCADRTIYCTHPPSNFQQGKLTISANPSPYYNRTNCECSNLWNSFL